MSLLKSFQVRASDDYDCSSADGNVLLSGKTGEDKNGDERFLGYLAVFLKGERIRLVNPKKLKKNSNPYKFSYKDSDLHIELNWDERALYFHYESSDSQEDFSFIGELICR